MHVSIIFKLNVLINAQIFETRTNSVTVSCEIQTRQINFILNVTLLKPTCIKTKCRMPNKMFRLIVPQLFHFIRILITIFLHFV